MAGIRDCAEFASEWGTYARDSFSFDLTEAARSIQREGREQSQALLANAIEQQVIPRLLQTRSRRVDAHRGKRERHASAHDIIDFVNLLLESDLEKSLKYAEAFVVNGATVDDVFLELFTPSARYIGKLWESDTINFTDVTIAISKLQQIVWKLVDLFDTGCPALPGDHAALLVAAPGDQHTFGVSLLKEFFRRRGWQVQGGSINTETELMGLVQDGAFDVIGLSVSNDVAVDGLASVIRAIREAALPRTPFIMVGGRFFLDRPSCAAEVGADATAQDGRRAVLRVSSLLGPNALR